MISLLFTIKKKNYEKKDLSVILVVPAYCTILYGLGDTNTNRSFSTAKLSEV